MKLDALTAQMYIVAVNEARIQLHEYVTPEHFLYSVLMFNAGRDIIENAGGYTQKIKEGLQRFFDEHIDKISINETPAESLGFLRLMEIASLSAAGSGKEEVSVGDLLNALLTLPECIATYIMKRNGVDKLALLRYLSLGFKEKTESQESVKKQTIGAKDEEFLRLYAEDLTELARLGRLDPLVGREDIIDRTIRVLCRRTKNNPVHVGDAGVGKTAVTEGLAQLIAKNKVPSKLQGARIFSVDIASVLAGTRYRGDFEERLIKILQIIAGIKNSIVYFDEIHHIVGAGAVAGGGLDASGILKPYLTRGEPRFIGSATFDDFKHHFEKNGALARRFQKIDINEPTIEECVEIVTKIKGRYEAFHNVIISDAIAEACVTLAAKHITDRKLPDKAIDVMDETAANTRINAEKTASKSRQIPEVTLADAEETVARWAQIPQKSVTWDENALLRTLKQRLKESVFGQDKAVSTAADAVRSSRAGLNDPNKPTASLLFVGPTGVGKTELARQLAKILNVKLLRFDMSEYQEQHSMARLIGSPPGYVGFDQGGLLTDEIRKTPYCVLLLDEIEKAHQDVYNLLLQVMDYGVLTDNTGKKADFRNVIIIMTSNAGAREIGRQIIGFDSKEINNEALEKEINRVFSPEFRNRLDEIITFDGINEDMSLKIATKAINELTARAAEKCTLTANAEAVAYIAKKGLSKQYGAREIIRTVNKDIKKLLTDKLLEEAQNEDRHFIISIENGKIAITEVTT